MKDAAKSNNKDGKNKEVEFESRPHYFPTQKGTNFITYNSFQYISDTGYMGYGEDLTAQSGQNSKDALGILGRNRIECSKAGIVDARSFPHQ